MTRKVVICVFDREEDLLGATSAARKQGLAIVDAYTPYALHGLDRAMGLGPSRLPVACFILGLIGATSILAFQFWASTRSWAINIGGRPWNSLPAFVPATFEMTVLFAGVGTVITFIVVAGLRPWRAPEVPTPRVTDDRFALVLTAGSATIDRADVEALLARFRPASVEEHQEVVRAGGGRPREAA